jgi:hypothetical protein
MTHNFFDTAYEKINDISDKIHKKTFYVSWSTKFRCLQCISAKILYSGKLPSYIICFHLLSILKGKSGLMIPPFHLTASVSTNWTIFTELANNIIPLLVIPMPNLMISYQQEYQHDVWTNLWVGTTLPAQNI